MNMQQMLQAAQKMQREYEKKKKILDDTEFKFTANGAVEVVLKGDFELVSVNFLDDEILKEDPEMVSDMIKLAYEGAREAVNKADEELLAKFQNTRGGFPF